MSYVGYSGVANQANTTDSFAIGVVANNVQSDPNYGDNVGANSVVALYHGPAPVTSYYMLTETTGFVLLETGFQITLEN
jgi:hypothetical protein